jgi:hypothetical protein
VTEYNLVAARSSYVSLAEPLNSKPPSDNTDQAIPAITAVDELVHRFGDTAVSTRGICPVGTKLMPPFGRTTATSGKRRSWLAA